MFGDPHPHLPSRGFGDPPMRSSFARHHLRTHNHVTHHHPDTRHDALLHAWEELPGLAIPQGSSAWLLVLRVPPEHPVGMFTHPLSTPLNMHLPSPLFCLIIPSLSCGGLSCQLSLNCLLRCSGTLRRGVLIPPKQHPNYESFCVPAYDAWIEAGEPVHVEAGTEAGRAQGASVNGEAVAGGAVVVGRSAGPTNQCHWAPHSPILLPPPTPHKHKQMF